MERVPGLILCILMISAAGYPIPIPPENVKSDSLSSSVCSCREQPHTYCIAASAAIPDTGELRLPIVVPWEYILMDVEVCLAIAHPRACELDVLIEGPRGNAGPVVQLSAHRSGEGADYRCTLFSDEAPAFIGDSLPPFSGPFRPLMPLFEFTGENAIGTWYLIVRDANPGAVGTVEWACVTLTGISCLPLTGVTLQPDERGGVLLHWVALETQPFRIWSTTSADNDGDPRTGDPAWRLEIEQTWPYGDVFWSDPDPNAPYKNYVVQRVCEFSGGE